MELRTVNDVDIKAATSPGENYASQMYRCILNVTTATTTDGKQEKNFKKSIIIKSLPTGEMKKGLEKFSAFEKESQMLTQILPLMNNLFKNHFPEMNKIGPECYYYEKSPNDVIIMEDLKEKNFVNVNRMDGLDEEHTTMVLETLAKFHASSMVLKKNNPELFEIFKKQIWSEENSDMVKEFTGSTMKVLSEDILTWTNTDCGKKYSDKLKNLKENIVSKLVDLLEPEKSKLNVLIHGDCWVNNIMFSYENSKTTTTTTGKLSKIKLIDYQLSCMNSPVIDLQYFLFTSVQFDLRFKNLDKFLNVYYVSLMKALNTLNGHHNDFNDIKYDNEEDFKKEFESKYLFGFIVFCTIFPHFTVPGDETLKPDELVKGNENKLKNIFKKENLRNKLIEGFKFFEEKNVF
ncbi:conserved hypothetical protein [Pediculus humanus corporis]|uniref:CHK kinase-like domain-containing protein n=1 Tax=Pediculus humanus subsp. corporis TaxID=121224 RepID=E0W1A2_PEDHC|nr:uncharacterized protein Phum_PHUM572000 [Pediculus humanus corporis]EEB19408.1 conserved hypothetical protein [Pediculus humanus corporis]